MTLAIETIDLRKTFAKTHAVDGISLQVARGAVYGLLGPNGAGKTTTIRMLATLLRPDGGKALVFGQDVVAKAAQVRNRISLTGQFASVDEDLTGMENLVLIARLLGFSWRDARQRATTLLEAFDLAGAAVRQVRHFSGGMRRRLDIAASLVRAADLLFLDEPTTGLDPQSRRQLWDMLTAYREAGRTVLITTHYMDEAQVLCDRVAIVDHGKVIALGTPEELIASLGAEHVVEFALADGSLPAADALSALPGVRRATVSDGRATLIVSVLHEAIPALLALVGTDRAFSLLTTHSATLEDVFVSLTGRQLRDG